LKGRKVKILSMCYDDVEDVIEIERKIFPAPWTADVFEEQLNQSDCTSYFVAKIDEKIVGYAGIIFPPVGRYGAGAEGHVTNIAVDENCRRRKIGSLLLLKLIEEAQNRGSRVISLELRKSNMAALNFYKKFGFRIFGLRKNYYSDTGEDAVVMFVDNVSFADYQNRLQIIRDSIGFGEV